MARRTTALVCALAAGLPLVAGTSASATGNPIRKVVNMLQSMQKKVVAEGEKAEDLFDKFGCYCTKSAKGLTASIAGAEAKVAELGPSIEGASSKKSQFEKDLAAHRADRAAAATAMEEAEALRNKEEAAYSKALAESKTNLAAMAKAVAALEKGMAGSFLQSSGVARVRASASDSESLSDGDRQTILAFLEGSQTDSDAPASGEVTGILKQMHDEMSKDQAEAIAQEVDSVKSYEDLMSAKKREVVALTKATEQKLDRLGQLGVEIAEMQNGLEDTSETLAEDNIFAADLKKNCATRGAVHEEEKTTRATELVALSETIETLNGDDALDLFKKTLPSASMSFLQVQRSAAAVRAEARAAVDQVRARMEPHQRTQLDFIALALHGQKKGFEEILALVDKLVATLTEEQQGDDKKKEYCAKELDVADDKQKALERNLEDIAVAIAETKDGIGTLTEEITALKDGIVALDQSVAEATSQRKQENGEVKQLMAENGAAKELILFAKNRLAKFYAPALYKPGAAAPALAQDSSEGAPPPPPAVAAAYTKKSSESTGVMQMMDILVADLDKEMTIAKTEEKNSQVEYEQTMQDSADKRALDSKSLTDKEAANSGLQASLENSVADTKAGDQELKAAKEYLMALHSSCDWLLQYYDTRKTARADEVDSLQKAQAVLSGADYSFLQTASAARTRKFLGRAPPQL